MISSFVLGNCTLVWVLSIVVCREREPTEYLNVVPKFENVERFYLNVRKANTESKEDQLEYIKDPHIRSNICKNILNNHIFRKLDIKYARMDRWYSRYYWDFRQHGESALKTVQDEDDVTFKEPYTLPSKKRKFYVGSIDEDVEENSFRCIALKSKKSWYEKLFLSKEYNINLSTTRTAIYVPGRFVFMYDDTTKTVGPKFVAVKMAEVLLESRSTLEDMYQEARRGGGPVEKAHDDPVCRLPQSKLIQICNSVMNSWGFEYRGRLVSYDEENIGCEKMTVAFKNYSNEVERKEWMINCQTTLFLGFSFNFYVSYGSRSDNFFVYASPVNRTYKYLHYLSSNVVQYLLY